MAGTITIPLPWTRPPLSHNDRMHWTRQAPIKARIATVVRYLARGKTITPPCEVVLIWTVTYRRRRDTDNPAPTTKTCIDGLKAAGVFAGQDDHWRIVRRSWCEIELGTVKAMRLEVRSVNQDSTPTTEKGDHHATSQ